VHWILCMVPCSSLLVHCSLHLVGRVIIIIITVEQSDIDDVIRVSSESSCYDFILGNFCVFILRAMLSFPPSCTGKKNSGTLPLYGGYVCKQ